MIFVTLGTHQQQFERALELVATLDAWDDLVIQHGATTPRPDLRDASWVDYLRSDDLVIHMRRADAVITHAGVGSMVTAIRNGKKPVVVPRLARFGEHVDDHQVELAERFAQRELVLVCGPAGRMRDLVNTARVSRPPATAEHVDGLKQAVAQLAMDGRGGRRILSRTRSSRSRPDRWSIR